MSKERWSLGPETPPEFRDPKWAEALMILAGTAIVCGVIVVIYKMLATWE